MNSDPQTLTYFLSVDPGFSNVGFITGYYLVTKDVIQVILERKETRHVVDISKSSTDEMVTAIDTWLLDLVEEEWLEDCGFLPLIENQYTINPRTHSAQWAMSIKLNCFQTAFISLVKARWRYNVTSVNTRSYKSKLQLTAPKTSTNRYADNKKLALDFAVKLLGCKKKDITHHIADCVNQLYFILVGKYPNHVIKFF